MGQLFARNKGTTYYLKDNGDSELTYMLNETIKVTDTEVISKDLNDEETRFSYKIEEGKDEGEILFRAPFNKWTITIRDGEVTFPSEKSGRGVVYSATKAQRVQRVIRQRVGPNIFA